MGLFDGDPSDIMSMIMGGAGGMGGMPPMSTGEPGQSPFTPPHEYLRRIFGGGGGMDPAMSEGTAPFTPQPEPVATPPVPAQGFDGSSAAPVGMPPVQGLDLAPDMIAKNAAARGVPPPPVDLRPSWADARGADFGGVGAALTGTTVPMPKPRPGIMAQGGDEGPVGPTSVGGAPLAAAGPTSLGGPNGHTPLSGAKPAGAKPDGKDRLLEGLKGVKAPDAPALQRLGTPAAPRPTTAIKGGDIIALLQSLGAVGGGGGGGGAGLPPTLGAALRR